MNKEIKLVFKLEEKDYYNFRKSLYYKSIIGKVFTIIGVLYAIAALSNIVLYGMIYYTIKTDKLIQPSTFVIWKDIINQMPLLLNNIKSELISMLIFLFVMPLIIKYSAKMHYKTNKLLQENQNYNISQDGIDYNNDLNNSTIKWEQLFKAIEFKNCFAIYTSNIQVVLFPKKYFDNVEDINLFRELIRTYIRKVKLRKK